MLVNGNMISNMLVHSILKLVIFYVWCDRFFDELFNERWENRMNKFNINNPTQIFVEIWKKAGGSMSYDEHDDENDSNRDDRQFYSLDCAPSWKRENHKNQSKKLSFRIDLIVCLTIKDFHFPFIVNVYFRFVKIAFRVLDFVRFMFFSSFR